MRTQRSTVQALLLLSTPLLLAGEAVAQTYSRTEAITYHDNKALWVVGQVAQVKCIAPITALPAGCGATGTVLTEGTFDPATALQLSWSEFGRLRRSSTYDTTSAVVTGQRGTLRTIQDGNSHITTLSDWKSGVPRITRYPATPEAPAGATTLATVDDNGWITSITDENGYLTGYGYDLMGRVSSVTYPAGDTVAWQGTTVVFEPVNSVEHGIAAGHWRETVSTGNARKISYFDSLWRPLLTHEYDNAAVAATSRYKRFTYDQDGRVTFASYPSTTATATTGTWTEYDPIGRATSITQDSELGPLTAVTAFSSDVAGAYSLVTDARGVQTVTRFQAFDTPTYEYPVLVDLAQNKPERAIVDLGRDIFGKVTSIVKRNSSSSISQTRTYSYNQHQELCRTIEPETGATVMGYDGNRNMTWSAAGLPVTAACSDTGNTTEINPRKVTRGYDARNRVTTLSFPDGRGNQIWSYVADGMPATITTYASAFDTSPAVNSYSYNRRRQITSESLTQGASEVWSLGYTYDVNGHLATQTYPDSQVVTYSPNALGQATEASPYVTAVSYYPNGATKQFTYGNGVVHTLVQNARQLPERSFDCAAVGASCALADRRLDLSYSYDETGNVVGVTDNYDGRQTRSMTYDGLARLTQAASPMFASANYTYNALDNITALKVSGGSGARDHTYEYDSGNRLAFIKDAPTGAMVIAVGYDLQGNVSSKNGVLHDFDFGNRLREVVGKEVGYTYDGHGRRVMAVSGYMNPRYRRFQYSADGRLMHDTASNSRTSHFYLAGSLVASRSTTAGVPGGMPVVSYFHTDALGTPTVTTNASKDVTSSREYEPYGMAINGTAFNRIGFAGHVEDAATQLTYMQQRYYDAQLGAFQSVDPITAQSNPATLFNRYRYANSNPYSFKDPDGRRCVHQNGKDACTFDRFLDDKGNTISRADAMATGSRLARFFRSDRGSRILRAEAAMTAKYTAARNLAANNGSVVIKGDQALGIPDQSVSGSSIVTNMETILAVATAQSNDPTVASVPANPTGAPSSGPITFFRDGASGSRVDRVFGHEILHTIYSGVALPNRGWANPQYNPQHQKPFEDASDAIR